MCVSVVPRFYLWISAFACLPCLLVEKLWMWRSAATEMSRPEIGTEVRLRVLVSSAPTLKLILRFHFFLPNMAVVFS